MTGGLLGSVPGVPGNDGFLSRVVGGSVSMGTTPPSEGIEGDSVVPPDWEVDRLSEGA